MSLGGRVGFEISRTQARLSDSVAQWPSSLVGLFFPLLPVDLEPSATSPTHVCLHATILPVKMTMD